MPSTPIRRTYLYGSIRRGGAAREMCCRRGCWGSCSLGPICDVRDLHNWTVGDVVRFLSCHVALPAACTLEQFTSLVETINHNLHHDFTIGHATSQVKVEGLCRMAEETDLYCAIKQHEQSHACNHSH